MFGFFEDAMTKAKKNYQEGLSYLKTSGGNVTKAIQLISRAADAGLMEATAKLVEIYGSNKYTKIDRAEALKWSKKWAEQAEKQFNSNPNAETAKYYFNRLNGTLELFEVMRKIPEAKIAGEKMISVAQMFVAKKITPGANLCLSIAYYRMGDVCKLASTKDAAKSYYGKSLEAATTYMQETHSVSSLENILVVYDKLAQLCFENNENDNALVIMPKCIQILEHLATATGDLKYKREIAICYNKIGKIYNAKKQYMEAEMSFVKQTALLEALLKNNDSSLLRKELSEAYNCLGIVCKSMDDIIESDNYFRMSKEILNKK